MRTFFVFVRVFILVFEFVCVFALVTLCTLVCAFVFVCRFVFVCVFVFGFVFELTAPALILALPRPSQAAYDNACFSKCGDRSIN